MIFRCWWQTLSALGQDSGLAGLVSNRLAFGEREPNRQNRDGYTGRPYGLCSRSLVFVL